MPSLSMKYFGPKGMKADEVRLEILNELRKQGTIVKDDFKKTTRTWDHQPQFSSEIHFEGTDPSLIVGTDDKIFKFVDEGTRAHWVRPKRGGMLAFKTGYRAKTSPGMIGSTGGGGFGPMGFSKGHKVSGIKKRGFTRAIRLIRKPGFDRAMQAGLKRGLDNIWEK
jgi:hypothetical protein